MSTTNPKATTKTKRNKELYLISQKNTHLIQKKEGEKERKRTVEMNRKQAAGWTKQHIMNHVNGSGLNSPSKRQRYSN